MSISYYLTRHVYKSLNMFPKNLKCKQLAYVIIALNDNKIPEKVTLLTDRRETIWQIILIVWSRILSNALYLNHCVQTISKYSSHDSRVKCLGFIVDTT